MWCTSRASGGSSARGAGLRRVHRCGASGASPGCCHPGCTSEDSASRRSLIRTAMTRSPVIGITLRVLHEKGLSADLARNRAYFDALEGAGGTPLGISASLSESRLRELFDLCDGLCLPGGPDVDPALYGEETRADCAVEVDEELDRAEMLLAQWALDADKPVLAICRGAQVLNVALGGTLWQDVGTQGATEHNHSQDGSRQELTHNIDVAPDTRLRTIAGAAVVAD